MTMDFLNYGVLYTDWRRSNIRCAPSSPPGLDGLRSPLYNRVYKYRFIDLEDARITVDTPDDKMKSRRQTCVRYFVKDLEDRAQWGDYDDSDEDEQDSHFDRLRSSSIPPLTSSSVFLYLFAPLLKLGAILAVEVDQTDDNGDGILTALPLQWAIPALCIFAVLCAFTRQIWYMLAKYVRRADMEEILLQAFARKRGNSSEKRRRRIRSVVRCCVGGFRVLLGVVYLRGESTSFWVPWAPWVPESREGFGRCWWSW